MASYKLQPLKEKSWRKEVSSEGLESEKNSRREKILLECEDMSKTQIVPFFITVMGKGGKLLFNVYPNRNGQREVQLFFNKGKYNDGLQIVRSCLRNMLSYEFDKIVSINVYKGFYLAVETSHSNESTDGYHTDKKYKNNIGLLEYVHPRDLEKFAKACNAIINPKLIQYIDEFTKYTEICKAITLECD